MGECGGDLLGKYGLSEHLGSGVGQVQCCHLLVTFSLSSLTLVVGLARRRKGWGGSREVHSFAGAATIDDTNPGHTKQQK